MMKACRRHAVHEWMVILGYIGSYVILSWVVTSIGGVEDRIDALILTTLLWVGLTSSLLMSGLLRWGAHSK